MSMCWRVLKVNYLVKIIKLNFWQFQESCLKVQKHHILNSENIPRKIVICFNLQKQPAMAMKCREIPNRAKTLNIIQASSGNKRNNVTHLQNQRAPSTLSHSRPEWGVIGQKYFQYRTRVYIVLMSFYTVNIERKNSKKQMFHPEKHKARRIRICKNTFLKISH